jgi:Na+-driven multidrug efflux pump
MGATVLSIILNFFWISRYGVTGAACATLLCEVGLIAMLSLQVWSHNRFDSNIDLAVEPI